MSQEPTLFARSIRRNIMYGLEGTEFEPSDEEIKEAARLANAASFIEVSNMKNLCTYVVVSSTFLMICFFYIFRRICRLALKQMLGNEEVSDNVFLVNCHDFLFIHILSHSPTQWRPETTHRHRTRTSSKASSTAVR